MFSAVAEQIGLDYDTAVKVSSGFGGGMYLGSVCGAVTGGIMALGVKYGGVGRNAMQTVKISKQFTDRFKARHKSVNCPDLIGVDLSKDDPLSNPQVFKALMEKNVFAGCLGYVKDAAAIVNELVTDPSA